MITIYYRAVKEGKLNTIDDFKIGSWVDVCDPNEEELDKIVSFTKADKSLLKDALDRFEVPRLEMESGVTYVFTRVPEIHNGEICTIPLLFVMGPDFVMTLSRKDCGLIDKFIATRPDIYTTQKTKFFLELFSTINQSYDTYLHSIRKRLKAVRIRMDKINERDIIQFVDYEKIINDFLSSLVPTNSVLQKLLKGGFMQLYEQDEDMIEDLFLETGQLIEVSNSTLKQVVNIRDAYAQIMTQDLNRIMKVLTALTVIFAIPTMIFSFYGMNVTLPFVSNPLFYLVLILFTIIVLILVFFVFTKNRWL